MTTRITNTLHETAEAVEVPAIDQVAFQQRVRAARRRRTAVRATVAVAASVALAAGVGVVGQWRASDEPGFAGNPKGQRASFEPMRTLVPFLLNGNLMVLPPDGKPVSADVETEEILGQVADGVLVVADESRVLRVPLAADGSVDGPAEPVIGDDPVQQAVLSKDGSTIGWIDLDDRLHLRRLAEPGEFHTEQLTPSARLVSVAADSWLILPGPKLRLATTEGGVELDAPTYPTGGEVAGRSVAAEGFDGVEFFEAPSGEPILTGGVGGTEGALSPDGLTYVAAASQDEVEAGSSPDLTLYDARTGKRQETLEPDGLRYTTQVTWTGSNFLLVGGDGKAERIYECSAAAKACQVLHTGEPGEPIGLATN